ncbi:uncharacterized protein LOC122250377 [Penaeus japonicus]|uniref:uncharacterized protein LOC122250377 n=1 Tax=Penaeus japonicus TaxID=27405 RepID=UPI001C711DC8|nr:uncharacterized protein LOC122250377 [Penaeus japonicus]
MEWKGLWNYVENLIPGKSRSQESVDREDAHSQDSEESQDSPPSPCLGRGRRYPAMATRRGAGGTRASDSEEDEEEFEDSEEGNEREEDEEIRRCVKAIAKEDEDEDEEGDIDGDGASSSPSDSSDFEDSEGVDTEIENNTVSENSDGSKKGIGDSAPASTTSSTSSSSSSPSSQTPSTPTSATYTISTHTSSTPISSSFTSPPSTSTSGSTNLSSSSASGSTDSTSSSASSGSEEHSADEEGREGHESPESLEGDENGKAESEENKDSDSNSDKDKERKTDDKVLQHEHCDSDGDHEDVETERTPKDASQTSEKEEAQDERDPEGGGTCGASETDPQIENPKEAKTSVNIAIVAASRVRKKNQTRKECLQADVRGKIRNLEEHKFETSRTTCGTAQEDTESTGVEQLNGLTNETRKNGDNDGVGRNQRRQRGRGDNREVEDKEDESGNEMDADGKVPEKDEGAEEKTEMDTTNKDEGEAIIDENAKNNKLEEANEENKAENDTVKESVSESAGEDKKKETGGRKGAACRRADSRRGRGRGKLDKGRSQWLVSTERAEKGGSREYDRRMEVTTSENSCGEEEEAARCGKNERCGQESRAGRTETPPAGEESQADGGDEGCATPDGGEARREAEGNERRGERPQDEHSDNDEDISAEEARSRDETEAGERDSDSRPTRRTYDRLNARARSFLEKRRGERNAAAAAASASASASFAYETNGADREYVSRRSTRSMQFSDIAKKIMKEVQESRSEYRKPQVKPRSFRKHWEEKTDGASHVTHTIEETTSRILEVSSGSRSSSLTRKEILVRPASGDSETRISVSSSRDTYDPFYHDRTTRKYSKFSDSTSRFTRSSEVPRDSLRSREGSSETLLSCIKGAKLLKARDDDSARGSTSEGSGDSPRTTERVRKLSVTFQNNAKSTLLTSSSSSSSSEALLEEQGAGGRSIATSSSVTGGNVEPEPGDPKSSVAAVEEEEEEEKEEGRGEVAVGGGGEGGGGGGGGSGGGGGGGVRTHQLSAVTGRDRVECGPSCSASVDRERGGFDSAIRERVRDGAASGSVKNVGVENERNGESESDTRACSYDDLEETNIQSSTVCVDETQDICTSPRGADVVEHLAVTSGDVTKPVDDVTNNNNRTRIYSRSSSASLGSRTPSRETLENAVNETKENDQSKTESERHCAEVKGGGEGRSESRARPREQDRPIGRSSSEDDVDQDNLEGPWSTPQLAKVVQELVVSRKFSMTTAQVKKRQQNLGRLDVSQKDRTVIFDSSRFPRNGSEKDCEARQERAAGKGDAQEEAKGAPKWSGRARSSGRNGVAWQQTAKKGRRRKSLEGEGSQSEASTDSHAPGEESSGSQEGRRHFTKHSCVKVSKSETKRSSGVGPRGKYLAWTNENNRGDSRGSGGRDENKVMPSPRIERMCRSPQLHKGRIFSSHRRESSSSRTSPRQSPVGSRYQSSPGAVSPRLGSSSRVGSPRPDSPRIASRSASPRRMSPRVSPRIGLRSSPTKFVTSRTSPITASPRIVKPIVTYGCQRSPRPTSTFDRQRSLSVDKTRNGRTSEILQKLKSNKENANTTKDGSSPSILLANSIEKSDSSRKEENLLDEGRGGEKAADEEGEIISKKDEKSSLCKGGDETPEDGRQKIFPRPWEKKVKGEEEKTQEEKEKTSEEEEEKVGEDDNSPDVPGRKVKHPGRAVRKTIKEGNGTLSHAKENQSNAKDSATTPSEETPRDIATGGTGNKKEKEKTKHTKEDQGKGKEERGSGDEALEKDREIEDVEKDKENRNEKVKDRQKERDKTNNNELNEGGDDLPVIGTPKPLKALRREMSDCRQRLESFVESRAMQEQRQQRYILITSKMSGKLDSEIIQFFESQQQKPREIVRNEKVLHEHFKAGSKSDLRRASGSSFRSKSASTEGDKSSEDAKEGSEDDGAAETSHDISFTRDVTRDAFPFLAKSAKESLEEEGNGEEQGRRHSRAVAEGKLEGHEKMKVQSKDSEGEKEDNERKSPPDEENSSGRNSPLYDTVADDEGEAVETVLPSSDGICNHVSITDHTGSKNTIPDDGNLRTGQGNDTIAGGRDKEEEEEEEDVEEGTVGGKFDKDIATVSRGDTGKREESVNGDDDNGEGGSDENRGELLTEALSSASLETAAFEEEERAIIEDEKINAETRVNIREETLINSMTDNVLVNESVKEESAKVKKGIVKEIIMQKEEEARGKGGGETYRMQQMLRRDISPTAPKGKDKTPPDGAGTKAAPRKPDADGHPTASPEGSAPDTDTMTMGTAVGEKEGITEGSKEAAEEASSFSGRAGSPVKPASQRAPLESVGDAAEGNIVRADTQVEETMRSPLLRRTVQSKETRTVEFNFVKGKGLVREERVVFRGARDLQEDVSDDATMHDKQKDASPKDALPKDASPKDAFPKDAFPKDASLKDVSPKDATLNDALPKDALRKDASPKDASLKDSSPKDASPKDATLKDASPKDATLKDSSPKDASPKDASLTDASPKDASPKDALPKDALPKDALPKDALPKDASPKEASPKEASPAKEGPKDEAEGQDAEGQSVEDEPDQNDTLTAEDERHEVAAHSEEDESKDCSEGIVVEEMETPDHEAVAVPHNVPAAPTPPLIREPEERVPEHMYANLPPPGRVVQDEPREVTVPPQEEEARRVPDRTTTTRRLMSGHRRLTKTISEGSFVAAEEPSGTERARPPSIRRSRTESEFLTDQLVAATTSSAERKPGVSQIFTRGVSGKVRMKSRSVENIRLSSLSCVEITNPIDSAPLPKSSSACRIVGVLKKKDSRENVLELMSPSKADEHEVEDEAKPQEKETTLKSSMENIDTAVLEQIQTEVIPPVEDVPEEFLSPQDITKGTKMSIISSAPVDSHIYENIPDVLFCRSGTAEVPTQFMDHELEHTSTPIDHSRKLVAKVVHIYENLPPPGVLLETSFGDVGNMGDFLPLQDACVSKENTYEECVANEQRDSEPKFIELKTAESNLILPRVVESNTIEPKVVDQKSEARVLETLEPPVTPVVTGKPPKPSSDALSVRRPTYEKASLRRKQPESESRVEKQKSNYMRQKGVRVGILKKQKSDITGVRLQKLHYFDSELPGERRRSYSIGGDPRKGSKHAKGDADREQAAHTCESAHDLDSSEASRPEMRDLDRRCHSSISASSNTSKSSRIDRILQSCAPCISSNTNSMLDLSVRSGVHTIGEESGDEDDDTYRGREGSEATAQLGTPTRGISGIFLRSSTKSKAAHRNHSSTSEGTRTSGTSEGHGVTRLEIVQDGGGRGELTGGGGGGGRVGEGEVEGERERGEVIRGGGEGGGEGGVGGGTGVEDLNVKTCQKDETITDSMLSEMDSEMTKSQMTIPSRTSLISSQGTEEVRLASETNSIVEDVVANGEAETAEKCSLHASFDDDGGPTPTPEQMGVTAGDTDFYSELLDTILSVVDAQESRDPGDGENAFLDPDTPVISREVTRTIKVDQFNGSNESFRLKVEVIETKKKEPEAAKLAKEMAPEPEPEPEPEPTPTPTPPAKRESERPSDSDSTASVDSELAEVRRRITERFPPAPRDASQASQESILASPSAVCPMPNCAACRAQSFNFSQPLVFTFDDPVSTPTPTPEPARAASVPYVDQAGEEAPHECFSRSASLPHDPEGYHDTQVIRRPGRHQHHHRRRHRQYWGSALNDIVGGSVPEQSLLEGHLQGASLQDESLLIGALHSKILEEARDQNAFLQASQIFPGQKESPQEKSSETPGRKRSPPETLNSPQSEVNPPSEKSASCTSVQDSPAKRCIQQPIYENQPIQWLVRDASLDDSALKDASIQEVKVEDTSFHDSTSQETTLLDITLQDATLQDSTLQDSTLQDTTLQDIVLQEAALQQAAAQSRQETHSQPAPDAPLLDGPVKDAPAQGDPMTDSGVEGCRDHSESSSNQLAEEMSQLRVDNEKLLTRNRSLQREVEELRRVKTIMEEDVQLKPQINQMTMELTHAKEALSALKADRKRLKAEKFDLLNQMKQLYATLEDKEKELRDFIRNYEQRMKESDESLRQLAAERDETEREKWNILKHARDESERVVKLSAELGAKESTIRKLQEELDAVRKQLISMGYHSDAESVRTNGLPTPTASTPACSPLPLSTPTPTPNGRGSSADSGVRLSSDRDSTASHEGTPTITVERGSLDCDTLSICSSATAASHYYYACGPGTPKESPSLSPLYATPVSLRGEDREDRGGDNTPTSVPTHSAASLNSSAMSGLASSNASTGGLSRSAEQLCERLAEAAESSKIRGCSTLTRKGHKGGGTWGSISRVFARQKKRAALDASLYDGSASDKRASWSPSSSLCASPLTEESYSEKLRLLEEAQHIPLERWKAPTVLAWLEVTLGMPQYGAMCAENIRSGKVLLELSDSELESGLGISHPMHRKKLRLAIEELREPRLTRFPRISILNHTWVSSEWLPDLGLPQYADAFANNLVDGRLLEALTKKELEKHLGVHRKFHQASIIHGVHLLRIVRFDRQVLAERRRQSEHVDCDPVVWTNVRWVRWARSVDLAEYADNLKDSGVHGALVVLESSFTADTMATALGIPQSKNIIRRHLATEMEALINPARQQIEEQARFAKMERRRQEKMAAGGSLGRSFSRSYGTGLEKGEKDKRRASLRPLQKKVCAFPTLPSKFGTWRSSQVLS